MNLVNFTDRGFIADLDDFDFMQSNFKNEIYKRSAMICDYGIVKDDGEPSLTEGPFSIKFTTENTIKINGGSIVFPSYDIFKYDPVELVLPDDTSIIYYIVAVVNSEYSDKIGSNRYAHQISKRTILTGTYKISPKESYVPFDNELIICSIGYNEITKEWYANKENPHWFSPKDIHHRNSLGTGIVTNTNPHGTSIKDINLISSLSFWDLMIGDGIITSERYKNMAGSYVEEVIPAAEIKIYATTAATLKDKYKVITPSHAVYRFIDAIDDNGNSFPIDVVDPYKLVFPSSIIGNVTIKYTTVYLGQCVFDESKVNSVIFYSPLDTEFAIVKGDTLSLKEQSFDLSAALRYAITYESYLTSTGIELNPKMITDSHRIGMLQEGLDINIELEYNSYIYIGLFESYIYEVPEDLLLEIKIDGYDEFDNNLSEVVKFDNTWKKPSEHIGFLAESFAITEQKFKKVSKITVINSKSLSLDANIALFAMSDEIDGLFLSTIRNRSETGLYDISDGRKIYSLYQRQELPYHSTEKIQENFTNPQFMLDTSKWVSNSPYLVRGTYYSRKLMIDAGTNDKYFYLFFKDLAASENDIDVEITVNNEVFELHTNTLGKGFFSNNSRVLAYELPDQAVQFMNAKSWVTIKITNRSNLPALGYIISEGF